MTKVVTVFVCRDSYKPVTALAGPNDDLVIPRASWEKGALDYEAELASFLLNLPPLGWFDQTQLTFPTKVIVIGKEASRVSEAQALDYVYGYTVRSPSRLCMP